MDLLVALLTDLRGRCAAMLTDLSGRNVHPDVTGYALNAYSAIAKIQRDIDNTLKDPGLRESRLRGAFLRKYKRWALELEFIEEHRLVLLQRYSDSDARVTKLLGLMCKDIGWSADVPVVVAMSKEYYWTVPSAYSIWVPAMEPSSMLGTADLCHELGHLLEEDSMDVLYGDFFDVIANHFRAERRRAKRDQRPQGEIDGYSIAEARWIEGWAEEMMCDMFATFVLGAPYGYQHVRLSSKDDNHIYWPGFGDESSHPSGESRALAILAVLRSMGSPEADDFEAFWADFKTLENKSKPQLFDSCCPQAIIDELATRVVAGCRQLGFRSFSEVGGSGAPAIEAIREAWTRFVASPEEYAEWERSALHTLLR